MKWMIAACSVFFSATAAFAQDSSLTGKYSGNYQSGAGNDVRVALNIKSVDDGAVKGTMERYVSSRRGGDCTGEVPVAGTFKENKLDVRTTEKIGKGDGCSYRFAMTLEGNKLVGKMGTTELTLVK